MMEIEQKCCKKCGEVKALDEFSTYFDKGLNKQIIKSSCKACIKLTISIRRNGVGITDRQKNTALNKELALDNKKMCTNCLEIKDLNIDNFRERTYKNGVVYFGAHCRICEIKSSIIYKVENQDVIREQQKKWAPERKQWKQDNKEEINRQAREKMNNDLAFHLRKVCSGTIAKMLKKNGSSKKGYSILEFLPYSKEELKQHMQNNFEYWMNDDNYGAYDPKTWDDNDQSTWKWNIDHIQPQSELPYTSMEDDNFKKCWSLDNLRPYSAKQNSIDGSTKIRHKKDKNK